jgi:hypothetical protein
MKMGAVIHRNFDADSWSRVAEGGNSLQTKTKLQNVATRIQSEPWCGLQVDLQKVAPVIHQNLDVDSYSRVVEVGSSH